METIGSTLAVFSSVTAYFMSVHREAKLRHTIDSLAHERDQILEGLPGGDLNSTQVLILSQDKLSKQLYSSP